MRYDIHHHRFGVNYTPTRAWYHCWNDFEPQAIARDLDAVAAIGADHIRLMLLWPAFQPDPGVVSQAHLERLDAVMRLAGQRGLDVCVTLFVGWLSGYAYKPAFQRDADFYDVASSGAAQLLYLRAVADVAARHGNFLGLDLGNELSCCWKSAAPGGGDAWSAHMLAAARSASGPAPEAVHVNGVDHQAWFSADTFSPQHLVQAQAIVPLHCWPLFTGAIDKSGGDALHPRVMRLPEAMAALARAHAGSATKPVWVQEYGMSESWTAAANVPRFLKTSTEKALAAGVAWHTWWCSHDLDRQYRFDPLEYTLGLIDVDNRVKPAGLAFKAIADEWRGQAVALRAGTTTPPPATLSADATWQWLDAWCAAHPATS